METTSKRNLQVSMNMNLLQILAFIVILSFFSECVTPSQQLLPFPTTQGPSSLPMTTPPAVPRAVAASARQLSVNVFIIWQGGQDNPMVKTYSITITNSDGVIKKEDNLLPNVGKFTLLSNIGTPGPDHVVVSAMFRDGSSQIVLDTYV